MLPYLHEFFGNPSSTHSHGREARSAIELSRKKIADLLGVAPSEIFFTSGGTEADNTYLSGVIDSYGIKKVITSPLEHHAVLHTLEYLKEIKKIDIQWLNVNGKGEIDLEQLDQILPDSSSTLVTLMHANNEIGNLTDIRRIGESCKTHQILFHSDMVQSLGKIRANLHDLQVDSVAGSAHKFHGPKGAGFMYIRKTRKSRPLLHGGGQERNMRSGTENVAGIVGMARALEIAYSDLENHKNHISKLKSGMIQLLKNKIPGVLFNGLSEYPDKSLYTILSVSLPASGKQSMPLFQMDLQGISVSGGSACASGALMGSHVLSAIQSDPKRTTMRFSFSRFNREEEIHHAVNVLTSLF
jgi:cysteine desulfurase